MYIREILARRNKLLWEIICRIHWKVEDIVYLFCVMFRTGDEKPGPSYMMMANSCGPTFLSLNIIIDFS